MNFSIGGVAFGSMLGGIRPLWLFVLELNLHILKLVF
jgi:hypothetical protein